MPKQKRLTDKEKAEVLTDYAAGKTQEQIAKKFNISKMAVSKTLKTAKSLQNEKKFTRTNKTQSELRQDIISTATEMLYTRVQDTDNPIAPETLLKIIERLSLLEDGKKDNTGELKIIVEKQIVDLSKKDNE